MRQMKIIYTPTNSLEEFRDAAFRAARIGATHMMAGQMPRSRWMWEKDLTDPYVNWSMGQAQIFKLMCPPKLREYLPLDHIKECFELFCKRCEILKEYDLEPALFSNEPFWLPEQVYRDHPDWRGARCDHPRRSRHAYFSPNVCNPEVLEMYQWAIQQICRQTGLSYINFKTNDCGGGLAFSSGTYCGPNGPESSRSVSMAEQVCGFIDAIYSGARAGGILEPIVHFSSDLEFKEPEYAVNASVINLKENRLINHKDRNGKIQMKVIGGTGLTEQVIPKLPKGISFLGAVSKLRSSDVPVKVLRLNRSELNEAYAIVTAVETCKPRDITEEYAALKVAAEEIVGSEQAGALCNALNALDQAYSHIEDAGLDLIQYGCMHQRWINRPFLLFPEALSEGEKAYYRDYQFQAQSEDHADDLMDLQGIEGVRGFTSVFMLGEMVRKADRYIDEAISELTGIAEDEHLKSMNLEVNLLIRRVKVYRCFLHNMLNACRFQELKDRTDPEIEPIHSCRWPTRDDKRAEEYQEIMRAEIDNAYELAALLDGYMERIFPNCTENDEDIFTFSVHLPEQLRHKAEIMLDHMTDDCRVYETNNV